MSENGILQQFPFLGVNCERSDKLFAVRDLQGGTLYRSPRLNELLGDRIDPEADLLEQLCSQKLVCEDDLSAVRTALDGIRAGQMNGDCYARFYLQNGQLRLFRLLLHRLTPKNGGSLVCLLLLDVQREFDMHMHLEKLGSFDQLTGVYNETRFCEKAHELMCGDKTLRYVVIRTNFEKFKLLNELFGVQRGDALLQRMATIGRDLARQLTGRCVYGRIRADIFAICCLYTPENIRNVVCYTEQQTAHFFDDFEVKLDFGIYVVEDPEKPVSHMVDCANLAMQTIRGDYLRNYVFYNEAIREHALREQQIVGEMTNALHTKEFFTVIQPKCDIQTGVVTGGEMLVRWQHPVFGMIPPSEFVPVLEKANFIFRLDCFVWERACQELRRQLDEGRAAVPLSVNLSRIDLQRPELLVTLLDLTGQYRIPRELFLLEITETGVTSNIEDMLKAVDRLREHGFTILLDDFGSAYSTFNLLNGIDLGGLKIDLRALIARSRTGERVEQLLGAFVYMADRLGIPTVIEGVETAEQVACARRAGIRTAQGYFFYKPLSTDEFRTLLPRA